MNSTNLARKVSRVLFASFLVAGLGLMAACGKQKAKAVEEGPRITSIYISSGGMSQWNAMSGTLTVNVTDRDQALSFQVNISTGVNYSQPKMVSNVEYELQSMCIDSYCDRIAFLLTKKAMGWNTNPYQNGNNTNGYIVGFESKAFLFRSNVQGGLEQVKVITGRQYSDLNQQVLYDLGAIY